MNEFLVNNGIISLGEKSSANPSTVVVVGSARGGTSLVAGALHHLGVFMGDTAHAPVFEDVTLSEFLETSNDKAAKELIDQYASKHTIWGWKRPSSIDYLKKVDKVFDKPMYIFIYKDIVSIAQRNAISMLQDVVSGMTTANARYENSLKFIQKSQCYGLLVSYEKAVANSECLVDSIIEFCSLDVSSEQRQNAIDFITPNPTEYLEKSRITKTEGHLDGVVHRSVQGWARFTHESMTDESVTVQLFLNDTHLIDVAANKHRSDLHEKFSTDCAFEYTLPEEITLGDGDVIRARAVQEANDLANSPGV